MPLRITSFTFFLRLTLSFATRECGGSTLRSSQRSCGVSFVRSGGGGRRVCSRYHLAYVVPRAPPRLGSRCSAS